MIDGKVFRGFGNSACEVGYMYMGDSDFQTLGAASTLTKKVAQWKGEPQENGMAAMFLRRPEEEIGSVFGQLMR